jgi:hypothetical protein
MYTLIYRDEEIDADIDLRSASTADAFKRELAMFNPPQTDPVLARAQQLLGTLTAAATIKKLIVKGQSDYKLTAESVLELPSTFTTVWEMRVYEQNPQWQYGLTADQLEEIQKKALQPSSGSKRSTKQPAKAS